MLQKHFTTIVRNFAKQFQFSIINTLGLSLTITAFILIVEFIAHETSFNRFHTHEGEIYRMVMANNNGATAYIAPGLPNLIKQRYAEVTGYCRIAESKNAGSGVVQTATASFRENNFAYADGTFFQQFSFGIQSGTASALSNPNTVAVSASTAKKLFGSSEALGQQVTLKNQFGKTDYAVVAIYDDMPSNSDLRYDLVFSIATLQNPANLNGNDGWASLDGVTSQWVNVYLQTTQGISRSEMENRFTTVLRSANPNESNSQILLQPLSQMHLGASLDDTLPTYSNLSFIYTLGAVACLILLLALFNYVNLSTAQSLKRAKEISIRKVTGATRSSIVFQFMSEAMFYSLLAVTIAIGVVSLVQDPFNLLVGRQLSLSVFFNNQVGLAALFILLLACIGAGSYVGFTLSGFKPSAVLRGSFTRSQQGTTVRQALIVVQFTISIALITFTLVTMKQSQYVFRKDLGMSKDQVLIIRGPEADGNDGTMDKMRHFENEAAQLPDVKLYSRSGNVPMNGFNFTASGITSQNPATDADKTNFDILTIDDKYVDTYGMTLSAGRTFIPTDCTPAWNDKTKIMINEKAAEILGYASPAEAVGEKVSWGERQLEVVGVIGDYNHLPVMSSITPMVFIPSLNGNYFSLKIDPRQVDVLLSALEKKYKTDFPGSPFEYYFLDDAFAKSYEGESRYLLLFTIVSGVAILIALLGLFGLTAFNVEQRTKEIGVRKVLGGSVRQITFIFINDFLKLALVAIILSIPLSYLSASSWLNKFAYHTDLSVTVMIAGAVVAVGFAILTILIRAVQGANADPVKMLRHE